MNNVEKMKQLISKINAADKAYFGDDAPIMTDLEYDKLVLELTMLEKITGIHFADSPIGKVPSDAKQELETVKHTKPMLSCNKTKSVEDIVEFANGREIILSWKMDGLTLVLRFENGRFKQAITRGSDGLVGEDVTHTVKNFRNIPLVVPCKERFEVRGEGVLSYEDFNILSKLSPSNTHPRSIASGAVRSINADLGRLSHLDFCAFELIKENAPATKKEQLEFLKENNFDVVEHTLIADGTSEEEIKSIIAKWTPDGFGYPVDGLVAEYNDIAYGKSLGATAHHEKRMLALKWKDEIKFSKFRGVDLVTTRSGVVSIVALFDEVDFDGTRVHRAYMHNLGNFERFKFGIGDDIKVYKANMIIPQIADNITRSDTFKLPKYCPCCNTELTIKESSNGVRELYCPNEECIARNAQKIARFCDKNAMNIEGLSGATIEKLMAYGWIKSFKDLYHLEIHREQMATTPGFGVDRCNQILDAIENSRKCLMHKFLVGLGIPQVGPEAAKALHHYYYGSVDAFEKAILDNFAFSHIDGISPTAERSIYEWYYDRQNQNTLHALMAELEFMGMSRSPSGDNPFFDVTVAVTGTFDNFTRNGIIELLTSLGARTSDNVTSDTDFLIYGSMPGNKKVASAMKKGVTMISEQKFAEMLEHEL